VIHTLNIISLLADLGHQTSHEFLYYLIIKAERRNVIEDKRKLKWDGNLSTGLPRMTPTKTFSHEFSLYSFISVMR